VQSRKIAELHRLWFSREQSARLHELLGRLLLAFGVDHLRPPQSFRLRLLGDGTHHVLVEVDMLDFHIRYLDPPRIRLLVEDLLNVGVEPIPLREHLVEFVLAKH
jgi:hypothetical protein